MSDEVAAFFCRPFPPSAASIIALTPGLAERFMYESPMLTISRFSSLSGITSATVPIAARSMYFLHML